MMEIDIKIKGMKETVDGFWKVKKRYEKAFGGALYLKGEDIIDTSVDMVPVDTGRLRGTHYVAPPKGSMYTTVIGYGTDYAFYQHENNPNGKSKYLSRALEKKMRGFKKHIASLIKYCYEKDIGIGDISAKANTKPEDKGQLWQHSVRAERLKRLKALKTKGPVE